VASGLPPLPSERLEFHVHAHLDVFVNGVRAPVPAQIGIDTVTRVISPLHTHDESGVVHIENDVPADFTVGQFFTEWAVRLTEDCIGGYCRPKVPWRVVVNGQDVEGLPNGVVFHSHDEVAFVIGTPPSEVPASFDFPRAF
jgi:hypothetical protein